MIVHDREGYEKKKDEEERLNRAEIDHKNAILNELAKESVSIITIAYAYALKFEEYQFDITERWKTAEEQTEIIQSFYNKGYMKGMSDGIAQGRLYEREEQAQKVDSASFYYEDEEKWNRDNKDLRNHITKQARKR